MEIIEPNLDFKELKNRKITDMLVLHHAEHSTCSVYDIHNWHKYDNGWSGIGYHFFITKDGQIYRGRPEKTIGAHCLGYNDRSIGICVQGDYMYEKMPEEQFESLISLCKYLCTKYQLKRVNLHKDLSQTNCPGTNFPEFKIRTNLCKDILKNIFT